MYLLYRNIRHAWRLIIQNRTISIVKVLGLALGITACLLLASYINWHWNYDRFHQGYENIVRIQTDQYQEKELTGRRALTYSGVPVIAKESLPDVEDYVRLGRWIANDVVFQRGNQAFRSSECFFVDPNFFQFFSFELIQGDPSTALKDPNSIVLSRRMAVQLFGEQDPLGQEITFENRKLFQVTGIVEDPPARSHIQFELLASLSTLTDWGLDVYGDDQFSYPYVYAYLRLKEETDKVDLGKELTTKIGALKPESNTKDIFSFQDLKEIHLYSQLQDEIDIGGNGNNIWIIAAISVFILLLGWANQVNFFFAIAIEKRKSLSIRKIVGASRKHLFYQLLVVAGIFALISLFGGWLISMLARPLIEDTFAIALSSDWITPQISNPAFILILILLLGTLLIAVLPAFFLSSIHPTKHLKGKITSLGNWHFRKFLIVVQFALLIALISTSVVVYQQTRYMQNIDLGMEVDNVLAIRAPLGTDYKNIKNHFAKFSNRLLSNEGIDEIAVSHDIPGDQLEIIRNVRHTGIELSFSFYRSYLNPEYFIVYDIPFIAMDTILPSEEFKQVVINETAAQILGYQEVQNALHQTITYWDEPRTIVGVVKNHHQLSLHHPHLPIIYDVMPGMVLEDGYYSIRVSDGTIDKFINSVERSYQEAFPFTVFDPIDVREHYNAQYNKEDTFKKMSLIFTGLGIIIACLGLFGLSMIILHQSRKEVGIRKILGSNNLGIIFQFAKILLEPVLWAIPVAILIAYIFISRWLQNFAFGITMQWWIFLFSAGFAFILAMISILFHSYRAAIANPVESIRNE